MFLEKVRYEVTIFDPDPNPERGLDVSSLSYGFLCFEPPLLPDPIGVPREPAGVLPEPLS